MHTNIMFLLTISQGQEVAQSAGQMPQTRGDLEALSRLAIEQIGASFGVPADLMFQGRFASKSTAQYARPWSLTHALIPFFGAWLRGDQPWHCTCLAYATGIPETAFLTVSNVFCV